MQCPGITQVEPQWLSHPLGPMCTLSAPLEDPPPAYSPKRDAVVCWHAVSFGPRAWPLPPAAEVVPDTATRCGLFAQALLVGRVLPGLKGGKRALLWV